MRKTIAHSVVLFSSILLLGSAFAADPRLSQMDEVVRELMKEGEVPGLSIAVIDQSRIIYQRSFGLKNVETRERLQDNAVFEAASLSKPVYAYAVMKLVETGKLKLDVPLSQYLNESYVKGDDRLSLITARKVLSHTSGLPNWRPANQPLKIHFTPGDRFSYSGEGFVYLKKVIEHLTHQPFNKFMKDSVFDPLGMSSSSYVWRKEYELRKTTGHNEAGNPQPVWKPHDANVASSLHTTAADYAKFVVAILTGLGLKQSTIGEMLTPQVIAADGCRECIVIPPQQSTSKYISWGLGWGLQKTEKGLSFWHWGDNNGTFQSYVAGIPSQNSGIVILTNSGNGHSIISALLSTVFGETHPAYAWIDYEPYNSPLKRFFHDIQRRGITAITEYRKAQAPFGESEINKLGYWLLGKKKTGEAIEVFQMNTADYPQSWNAHDSLGEAYLINGNKELSIESYRKSLQFNPQNSNATEALKKLTALQK